MSNERKTDKPVAVGIAGIAGRALDEKDTKPKVDQRVAVWIHGQSISYQGESGEIVKVLDRTRVIVKLRNGQRYEVSRARSVDCLDGRPPLSWDYLV